MDLGRFTAPCRSPRTSRRSPASPRRARVLFVERRDLTYRAPRFAYSAVLRALQTSPQERDPCQVEAIYSMLNTWPSFYSQIKEEQFKRDVCRSIIYEQVKENRLVYGYSDLSDGWYFVLSGKCILVDICDEEPTNPEEIVPPTARDLIMKKRFHEFCYLKVSSVQTARSDFGKPTKKKGNHRDHYCVTLEPTVFLKIDPFSYSLLSTKNENTLYERRINLLMNTRALLPLTEQPDYCDRVADRLSEIVIDAGTVINKLNPIDKGFVLIESGTMVRRRNVNFDNVVFKPDFLDVGDTTIKLPKGSKLVTIERLSDHCIVALPPVYTILPKDFEIVVTSDVKGYYLDYKDYFTLVPIAIQRKLDKVLIDNSTDQEIIEKWVSNQKEIQWRLYRKRCLKDARLYNKTSKNGELEEIFSRTPKLPKAMKDHKPFRRIKCLSDTI